jgi:hypothetical protein
MFYILRSHVVSFVDYLTMNKERKERIKNQLTGIKSRSKNKAVRELLSFKDDQHRN